MGFKSCVHNSPQMIFFCKMGLVFSLYCTDFIFPSFKKLFIILYFQVPNFCAPHWWLPSRMRPTKSSCSFLTWRISLMHQSKKCTKTLSKTVRNPFVLMQLFVRNLIFNKRSMKDIVSGNGCGHVIFRTHISV